MSKHIQKSTLIIILIAAAMFCGMCLHANLFAITDQKKIYTALCDAFFLPGMILSGFGLIFLFSYSGFFDLMSYGIQLIPALLKASFKKESKHDSFFDYKMRKQAKRIKYHPQLLWSGLCMILCACVCLILYYTC